MRQNSAIAEPIRGYGLMIYEDQNGREICGSMDGSPVLTPTGIERQGGVRRIRFSEGSRKLRQLGDIFCADPETVGLVRRALNELFERESAAANAFRVTSARVSRRQRFQFLYVGVSNMATGANEVLDFTLEAPDFHVQQDGQVEFGRFIDALGLASVDDSDQLVGRTATFEKIGERRVYARWTARSARHGSPRRYRPT